MEKFFDANLHHQRSVDLFVDPPKEEKWNAFSFPPRPGETPWSGKTYGTINETVMNMDLHFEEAPDEYLLEK